MTLDQNSVSKHQRPLNVARNVAEEPCIAVATTANQEFFSNLNRDSASPGSIPIFYPTMVPDSGFVGLGYGNAVAAAPANAWGSHMPVLTPVGYTGVKQVIGYDYNPNFGNMVVGNAVDQISSDTEAGFVYAHELGNMVSGSAGSDQLTSNNELPLGYGSNPNLGSRGNGNAVDHASDEGGDNSASGKKVKFLCSFGGQILPRPSDGMLRYVGGQMRIISVRRDINFNELVQKMAYTFGQPVVIKYQLPDEGLDALVSVSCPDDLDNMMEEYEKLVERSLDGSAKLRLFLFLSSKLDTSGLVQFGDLHDSGQRYVEAVNGIMEGREGCGITRKQSIASQTSTQNTDLNGSEDVDGLFPGQGDANGPSSTSNLSPRGNSGTSHEIASTTVWVDPNPAISSAVSAISLDIPVIKSGPLILSSQPEVLSEGAVPITTKHQMVVDPHQRGGDILQYRPYMQSYMEPHKELINRADYLHLPPQMGFPSHLLGHAAPVLNQQQLLGSTAGFTSPQFIPAMHMTMAPSSSHVGIRSTMVQPLMQPQQTQLEQYPDESTFGTRFVQLPHDQCYNVYPSQVPSVVVGGPYVWPQITPTEHVVISDGAVPHQPIIIPQKIPKTDDCHMCQKALPHAHSDPLVPDQRDSGASMVSDSNSVCHSPFLEDVMRTQPVNKVMVTGALGEGVAKQGAEPQTRVFGIDHQIGVPQSEAIGLSQNIEAQHENARIHQKPEPTDYPRIPVTHGVIGLTGDIQPSYGVFMGAISQSSQEDAVLQQPLSPQYQVNQEALVNKHVNSDVPHVGLVHVKSSELLVYEYPKENCCKNPAAVSKDDTVNPSTILEHLRPIDGMIEALRISPTEFDVNNEQNKLHVDDVRKEHIMDGRPQHIGGRKVPLENAFGQPSMVLDTSQMKAAEVLAGSNAEVPYMNDPRLLESYEVAQPPVYQHAKVGIQHLDSSEACYGNPPSSASEPAHLANGFPPAADWKDEVLCDAEAGLANVNKSSLLPSARVGDAQDSSNSLFSNQDPWNFRQDTHFPPPRPNVLILKNEGFLPRDPFNENLLGNFGELISDVQSEKAIHQPLDVANKNFNSEHTSSKKGSAEELIKQELQAVAEGVAASVFLSTIHSNPDSSAIGIDESGFGSNHEREVHDSDVERQHKTKLEGFKNKVTEKANVGFPVSDGIGRLQIIKNSDLEEMRELGSGTFGTVYHGKWRGTDVAIKRINDRCFAGKPSEQEHMIDDFWNEAINLADLHHPNVVAFYGVVLDGPGGSMATVTEYMVNGSLRNALQKNERNLDKRKRLLIAMDVAFGMEYLHGKNIVHFDLKSDNLLVNLRDPHRPICKVGDLGLSKVKRQTLISGGVRGTLPWIAPELLNGSSSLVSEKVDVFSFGIVLWELLTGEEPYADLHYGAIIGGIVSNTLRPPVPESCDPEWRSLMERCWSSEPSERPNFTEIANDLRSMASKVAPKGQNPPPQPQVHK